MLSSLPNIPTWEMEEPGFESQLPDPKAHGHLERTAFSWRKWSPLALPWWHPIALGPCGLSLSDFRHYNCDRHGPSPASSRGSLPPALPASAACLPGDLMGLWKLAPPCLSHWVFLTPSSRPLGLQLPFPVMSPHVLG